MICPGAALALAVAAAAPSARSAPKCPQLAKIVNGQPIRQGQSPSRAAYASGEKKVLVSVEMALTPLEFETAGGLEMRVPANVMSSAYDCDDRGRVRSATFHLLWVEGKLVAPAEGSGDRENWGASVFIYARFADPSKALPPEQRKPHIEREKQRYGPPEPMPQFGFIAYARSGVTRPENTWDAFVLDKGHGAAGMDITYLCEVGASELSNGRLKPTGRSCRSYDIGPRNGFGTTVDIQRKLLPDAGKITEQLIRILNSYAVKE